MATVYELKTMSRGYQVGNSQYFNTREEAEQARKVEKAADKAYKKFALADCDYAADFNFRYYIKKHENAILWTVHTKKAV